jgi:hypothetical protein
MHRSLAVAALSLLAVASTALAAPVKWGGAGFNDLGNAYALLSVANGKVKVTNVQMILACTDTQDGTESERAFDARYRTATPLDRNRYAIDFTALSGGRLGHVRLNGVLRSNGRGTIRIRINAVANSDEGAVIERCQGETRFALRRGPAG